MHTYIVEINGVEQYAKVHAGNVNTGLKRAMQIWDYPYPNNIKLKLNNELWVIRFEDYEGCTIEEYEEYSDNADNALKQAIKRYKKDYGYEDWSNYQIIRPSDPLLDEILAEQ